MAITTPLKIYCYYGISCGLQPDCSIKTPTTYVISDVELVAAAADSAADHETKNPDTGANDVVGVAAALAVVSLLAAGAVSLKK